MRAGFLFFIVLFIPLLGCSVNTSSSGTGGAAAGDAFPQGLVFTSPLAGSTPGPSPSPTASPSASPSVLPVAVTTTESTTAFDSAAIYAKKAETFATIFAAASASDCEYTLPEIPLTASPSECFGPALEYENHLDGPAYDGIFAAGDLGLWTAKEGWLQSCLAAKFTELYGVLASQVDIALLNVGGTVCEMKAAGRTLPAEQGSSSDITSLASQALGAKNSGSSVSYASVLRKGDVSSAGGVFSVHKFTVNSIITVSGVPMQVVVNLHHIPTSAENATFKGRMWAQFTGFPTDYPVSAFTLLYEKTATSLNYRLVAASYPASPTKVFDDSGDLMVNGSWGANITQIIANVDPSTGLGNVSFSWQPSTSDTHARVFHLYTKPDPLSTSTVGCGYYGFGPKFDNAKVALPSNAISNFFCNWSGPSASKTRNSGKAQKQCVKSNDEGVFVPTSSAITYAPVNSCSMSLDQTAANGGIFQVKSPLDEVFPGTHAAVTHDLVTLSKDEDYVNYTAPTAPDAF